MRSVFQLRHVLFPRQYHPARINRPASGFTFTQRRLCSPQAARRCSSLTAWPACSSARRVVVEYLLPLPPQNARAISSAETRTMVSHVWLTMRLSCAGSWLRTVSGRGRGSDSLRAFVQFRFYRFLVLAAFSISPVFCCCAFDFCSSPALKDCS